MYRKFEGEADRSHHGPAPNRLYSTAHNMRTWISEGKVSRICVKARVSYERVVFIFHQKIGYYSLPLVCCSFGHQTFKL